MNIQYKQKGFTIIEVVLVLAIAGLIFLMVFIALPALQASQRDTARKNDASIVSSWVTSYVSNNQGTFPGSNTTDTTESLTTNNIAVSNNTTKVVIKKWSTAAGSVTATDAEIDVYKGMKCGTVGSDGAVTLTAGTGSSFVTVTKLEASGGTAYCLSA